MRISRRLFLLSSSALLLANEQALADGVNDALIKSFEQPPMSARPRVWWHWMNGNITRSGIRKDLEWMKRVGIGGMQTFDAALSTPQIVDKRLAYMTPEWRDAFRYSAQLASTLDLELAIAASPGWSETGGPWVKPENAMKKVVWSETEIEGGKAFSDILPAPPSVPGPFQSFSAAPSSAGHAVPSYYADTVVLAFPAPAAETIAPPVISTSAGPVDRLPDGKGEPLRLPVPSSSPAWIRIDYPAPRTVRSASIALPAPQWVGSQYAAVLEASIDGQTFNEVARFPKVDSLRTTISFPTVRAAHFRFLITMRPENPPHWAQPAAGFTMGPFDIMASFRRQPGDAPVSELVLHEAAAIHRFEEKGGYALARDYYELDAPPGVEARGVSPGSIIDLTSRMKPDGHLDWTPPPGRWKVLRFGYSLTGKENHPAPAEATGLEVDKLDRSAVRDYIESYLDKYAEAVGPGLMGKRGLRALLNDSTEVGPQNWTAAMITEFKMRRGYDPTPWLLTLAGVIVDDAAKSDGFLYDFRRTISELTADSHYAQLGESARKRGLIHYSEALENGRPATGDDMAMRSHASIPMAAIWCFTPERGPLPVVVADIRGAASVAHIYGQNLVAAESLTSAMSVWAYAPRDLKPIMDLELALGVNRPVIHTSPHQPRDDRKPGLTLSIFGQTFTRHETWAEQAKAWVSYISRSAHLLQQGRFEADVLYFYGEEAPLTSLYMDGVTPDAPRRHGFDFANADVLHNLISVEDGELRTRSGMRYKLIWLGGTSRRLTVPMLKRLRDLIAQGATVAGERPTMSPSLPDDPAAFKSLIVEIWGEGAPVADRRVGRGRVLSGVAVEDALAMLGVAPDVEMTGGSSGRDVMFLHRSLADGDLYFLTNRKQQAERFEISLRAGAGRRPEIWRAETGKVEAVSWRRDGDRTVVALDMAPQDAFFLMLRKRTTLAAEDVTPPLREVIADLRDGWKLHFPSPVNVELADAPLGSWSGFDKPELRYFSGTARYTRTVRVTAAQAAGARFELDLGTVDVLAEVFVNGVSQGIVWHAPYRIALPGLRVGSNTIEVRVTNLWINRLIGDSQPGATVTTFTGGPTYAADAPLRPSGLTGPVTLVRFS